jgi:hypothetical protein
MSSAERIDLAFVLGEQDIALYMEAHACDRESAIAAFRAARQVGRRPSKVSSGRRA